MPDKLRPTFVRPPVDPWPSKCHQNYLHWQSDFSTPYSVLVFISSATLKAICNRVSRYVSANKQGIQFATGGTSCQKIHNTFTRPNAGPGFQILNIQARVKQLKGGADRPLGAR